MNKKNLKEELRKEILKLRDQLIDSEHKIQSEIILKKLKEINHFKKAKKILFYFPIRKEVNTVPLIEKSFLSKEIFLPKIQKEKKISIHKVNSLRELEPGKHNIPEPSDICKEIDSSELDLVIMPGVAFNKKGVRIGYGGGYYDRFLKNTNCPKIALAYDFQIHENVPGEIHDEKVDLIITEKNTIHTHL